MIYKQFQPAYCDKSLFRRHSNDRPYIYNWKNRKILYANNYYSSYSQRATKQQCVSNFNANRASCYRHVYLAHDNNNDQETSLFIKPGLHDRCESDAASPNSWFAQSFNKRSQHLVARSQPCDFRASRRSVPVVPNWWSADSSQVVR